MEVDAECQGEERTITTPPPRPVSDPRNPAATEPAKTSELRLATFIDYLFNYSNCGACSAGNRVVVGAGR